VKTQAARENLQRWQAGEPEAINSDPAVIDLRERGAAIQKRDNELRPAYRDANNRAWNAINAAQNTLHSLQLQAASFDQSDGEQGDGLILIQDEIKRLEREIRNRNAEISERNRALADLAAQKKDVEDRINARYQAISAGRAVIGQRILGESERVEAELEAVIQNAKKAQSTSALVGRIFGFDNLVSNDIALAVLTQGKGSLIESEIGKRVWQFSLLLTVVIMFIDLGPVIILLFLDKGACEFAIEQNNLNEHFRLKTETAAFQKNYPEMAQITERDEMEMLHWSGKMEMQKQYVFLEMDLGKEMLQKVFDSYTEFNSILDTMWRRLDQDTIALVARTKEIENEDLKKTTITFREELLRQFEETKNKMMLEFKNFIQSFSLSFPSTSR
jgi:hypothetical protein